MIRSKLIFIVILMCCCTNTYGQQFELLANKKYQEIDFKPVGKLIYIPVTINNVPLNFILDTGVNKTVILSLSENDTLHLNHTEEIFLTGLGKKEPFRAVYSTRNNFRIGDIENKSLDVFIVTDEEVNFSKRLGVEVHGVIGYDLLKDFVVQIDYIKGKIRFYPHQNFKKKKLRNEDELPLNFQRNKPYVLAQIKGETEAEVMLLLDTGSTDALWLFESDGIKPPTNFFEDYLGLGLTGEILGKRSKVEGFELGKFELADVKSAFPDEEFLVHVNKSVDRDGTLGAEILSRFDVTMDYRNKWVRFKKNREFNVPFYYNMSGITIQHNGLRILQEFASNDNNAYSNAGDLSDYFMKQLKYKLAPVIEISELRTGSPAEIAGLQTGDILLSVNGRYITDDNIEKILELLNAKEGRKVRVLIERQGEKLKFQFVLKALL